MDKGYFMPKNVFKGTDSNGNSYRFEEWDFATLATIEGFGWLFTLITAFALGSIAAPLILALLLIFRGVNLRFTYLIPALISTYVLYDFAHGWLCLISISFFLSDKYLGYVMTANIITLLTSIVFIIFGGLLNKFVFEPVSHLTEEEYNNLKLFEQQRLFKKVEQKTSYVLILVYILFFVGFLIGFYINNENKNWVNANIERVENN